MSKQVQGDEINEKGRVPIENMGKNLMNFFKERKKNYTTYDYLLRLAIVNKLFLISFDRIIV